jgi:hypothetical protein
MPKLYATLFPLPVSMATDEFGKASRTKFVYEYESRESGDTENINMSIPGIMQGR